MSCRDILGNFCVLHCTLTSDLTPRAERQQELEIDCSLEATGRPTTCIDKIDRVGRNHLTKQVMLTGMRVLLSARRKHSLAPVIRIIKN